MEITEKALRHLVQDVDEQHRSGMRTLRDDIGDAHAFALSSRRQLLTGAGVGAAALAAVGLLGPRAARAEEVTVVEKPPTPEEMAAHAMSIELAAVEAYKAAAASGKVTTPAVAGAAATFMRHHQEHAAALGSLAGSLAVRTANKTLLQQVGDQITAAKDENAVVRVAYTVENAAAATYFVSLGAEKMTKRMAEAIASILPVESQHAVVLGTVLGLLPGTDAPELIPNFETIGGAIDPAKFPA